VKETEGGRSKRRGGEGKTGVEASVKIREKSGTMESTLEQRDVVGADE